MFKKILSCIDKIGRFSDNEKALFIEKLKPKSLKKDDIYLKEGIVCSDVCFINTGSARLFHINQKGEDLTLKFFTTGDWMLDSDSFTSRKASENTLICTENIEILELSIHDLHNLIAISQSFLQLGRILYASQRPFIYDNTSSPEEKYRYLMVNEAHLLQKFPLKQVASYLKMTPETLSRVRRKIKEH